MKSKERREEKMSKIRTTGERDVYGTGNTKEIVDSDVGVSALWQVLVLLVMVLLVDGFFIGGSFLIFKLMGY